MNNQFNNGQMPPMGQAPGQVPQQPLQAPQPQPAPQQQYAAPQPAPQPAPGSSPFEMPPSAQMGQGGGMGSQPGGVSPMANSRRNLMLIVVLIVILVLGGLVLASWAGWIRIGFMENIWGRGESTSTETITETTTEEITTPVLSNDETRKKDLASIATALKAYYAANQKYPTATTVQKTNEATTSLTALVPTYIAVLPTDPLTTRYYGYKSDGTTFELTCVLDDATDPSVIKVGTLNLYKVTDQTVLTTTTDTTTDTTTTTTDTTTDTTTTETDASGSSASSSAEATAQ